MLNIFTLLNLIIVISIEYFTSFPKLTKNYVIFIVFSTFIFRANGTISNSTIKLFCMLLT